MKYKLTLVYDSNGLLDEEQVNTLIKLGFANIVQRKTYDEYYGPISGDTVGVEVSLPELVRMSEVFEVKIQNSRVFVKPY